METRTGAAPTWREAFDSLVTSEPRSVEEWSRLAALAYLTRPDGWDDWSARAVEACVAAGAGPAAARCAFWLGFGLMDEGRAGRGAGWMARAEELLGDLDCAERGLLMAPVALGLLETGDAATALERFIEMAELGERHADADVATIARLGRGQALVELGDRDSGVALMDQAMVAVQSDALSPQAAGLVTCGAIVTCQRLLEVTRAQEWVFALSTWCDAHSDLVPYRGQCLVHRAEVLRMRGSWPEATAAAEAACTWLDGAPAVGDAWYERGELHRLRGEHEDAEAAYRRASLAGRDPQPGLAFLRLEQGDVAAATGSIRRLADEARGQVERARALAPYVEISLAAGELADARTGVDELTRIARQLGGPADARHRVDLGGGGRARRGRAGPGPAEAPARVAVVARPRRAVRRGAGAAARGRSLCPARRHRRRRDGARRRPVGAARPRRARPSLGARRRRTATNRP